MNSIIDKKFSFTNPYSVQYHVSWGQSR